MSVAPMIEDGDALAPFIKKNDQHHNMLRIKTEQMNVPNVR